MRPSVAAMAFGSAIGGPPVLAQAAPNLSWLTLALSALGSLFVAYVALQWKRTDDARNMADSARADAVIAHARRMDESLAVHTAAIVDLKQEMGKVRERLEGATLEIAAVKLAIHSIRFRKGAPRPKEEPR